MDEIGALWNQLMRPAGKQADRNTMNQFKMNREMRRKLKLKGVKMEAKKRTIEDVKADFVNTCARLGNIEYTRAQLENEKQELMAKVSALNAEAAEISKEASSEESKEG